MVEQNQLKDGSVKIPEVLQKYMGGMESSPASKAVPMKPEKRPEDLTSPTPQEEAAPPPAEETPPSRRRNPTNPYSRKARLWAWVGIAFMVFLTIMYAYAFASRLHPDVLR